MIPQRNEQSRSGSPPWRNLTRTIVKPYSDSVAQRTLLLLLLSVGTVTCVESVNNSAPSVLSSPSVKLKLCVKNNPGLPQENFLELPTFSVKTFNYTLEKHVVDRAGDFFLCKNGGKPIAITDSAVISKRDFDHEYLESGHSKGFLFGALRFATFLFNNNYLSVGQDGVDSIYYSPAEYCIESVEETGNDRTVVFKTCPFPKERPALTKCCPLGMVLADGTCITAPQDEEWNPRFLDATTKKFVPFEQANPVFNSPKLQCDDGLELWEADGCTHEFHPVTDGRTAYIGAHRIWEFFPLNASMCIDRLKASGKSIRMVLITCAGQDIQANQDDKMRISLLYMINMYVGAIFHFFTTLVYILTWKKQNIHGKTLSSVTASLFFFQIFLGNAHLIGRYKDLKSEGGCIANSIGGHYFMIAAFTWLLVLNVDLWRTFRSIRASSNNSLTRFLKYSAWGWGFPLVVTIISLSLEFTFKCRVSGIPVPEYGHHYCFVAPWAQGYYVYYILSMLFALIVLFAVLTLFALWAFKKDTSNLRSSKENEDKQNFFLLLKLVVVMGFSWGFELISWAATDDNEESRIEIVWMIFDFYNALSAILIFIIFVCKRTTLTLLEQSCPILKGLSAAFGKFTSNFTGETASDNTASTVVGGNGGPNQPRKKSSPGGETLKVHYTKNAKEGGDNSAYE